MHVIWLYASECKSWCGKGISVSQLTYLVSPDSSVVRASGIFLDGPGFNSQSGCLFCLTSLSLSITFSHTKFPLIKEKIKQMISDREEALDHKKCTRRSVTGCVHQPNPCLLADVNDMFQSNILLLYFSYILQCLLLSSKIQYKMSILIFEATGILITFVESS